jgi:hypothetical protein
MRPQNHSTENEAVGGKIDRTFRSIKAQSINDSTSSSAPPLQIEFGERFKWADAPFGIFCESNRKFSRKISSGLGS